MEILNCTHEQWYEKENEWGNVLLQDQIWNEVPLLNANELHNLKESRLVRFRGMIQDMHETEFYLEKFEIRNEDNQETYIKLGKYTDSLQPKANETFLFDGPNSVTSDRHTFVAVSIPAINSWVTELETNKYKLGNSGELNPPSTSQIKRPHDDKMDTDESSNENPSRKKHCNTPQTASLSAASISHEYLLNFPIPDSTGKVCHLKVYKNSELLKLNLMYEFVGFLSLASLEGGSNEDDLMNESEFLVHNPPASLIPRIHCVAFKPLIHNNPLITSEEMTQQKMKFLYKELRILLTQLLFGDELAADYIICHLISEVYLRRDLIALGKFSLNLSNIPVIENVDYGKEFYAFLELLVPKSHYLPMSLQNMNELTFIPKKDYTLNRLASGILQLSPNTHLVLDETKLTPGKLNEAGVNAVKALANCIKDQKNTYDFTYYQLQFDCDIPCLVLSEGKSMLPSDVHVILEPDEMHLKTFVEILEAARHFLKPDLLSDIRAYLTWARLTKYEFTDAVQEIVEKQFVDMRQKENVSGDDLHRLLVLARLTCMAEGKTTLDEESWKKACDLEERRRARIKSNTPSN